MRLLAFLASRGLVLSSVVSSCWLAATGCGSEDGKRVAADSAGAGGEGGATDQAEGGEAPTPSAGAGGAAPDTQGGATGEAGGGGAPSDNCPDVDDPDQSDLDQDGLGDLCDDDIDGDGFLNADDPDPLDATLPGDFSSVEAILANELIAAALTAVEAAEFDLAISTDETPPDMTGFYRKPDMDGTFVATSNEGDIGRTVVGLEHFDLLRPGGLFDSTVAGFSGTTVVLTSEGRGNFVRGSGAHFSSFSRDTTLCTQGGSNYRTWSIRIVTGDQEAVTGDVVNLQVLAVTVGVDGQLTLQCQALLAGESELVGGWSLWQAARDAKIEPSALSYLCVDAGEAVYLPGAMFTDANGASCSCDAATLTCE